MSRLVDRTGQKVGRLVVVRMNSEKTPGGKVRWDCLCECGVTVTVVTSSLGSSATKSCGCLKREVATLRSTKHGMCRSSIYGVWSGMLTRCNNQHCKDYPDYGGRGITVCDRWLKFENFYADMGDRPSLKYSLDRIDNDGPYSPENCQWATPEQQRNNKRSTHYLTLGDLTLSISQWTGRLGYGSSVIYDRLNAGWSVERTLTTPPKVSKKSVAVTDANVRNSAGRTE